MTNDEISSHLIVAFNFPLFKRFDSPGVSLAFPNFRFSNGTDMHHLSMKKAIELSISIKKCLRMCQTVRLLTIPL